MKRAGRQVIHRASTAAVDNSFAKDAGGTYDYGVTIHLQNEVDAAERSAEQLEKIQAEQISLCYEIESLMAGLASITAQLVNHVELTNSRKKQGTSSLGIDDARETHAAFVRLAALFERVGRCAQRTESFGFAVDGKDKFRKAWRDVQAVAIFDFDATMRAEAQFARGEGRELHEFMNELQNQSLA